MDKICKTCGLVKPLSGYAKKSDSPDGLRTRCKDCNNAIYRERYARNVAAERQRSRRKYESNREASRRRSLKHTHNLTPEQYDVMLAAQGGVCAICGSAPMKNRLAIDHDHACCPGDRGCGGCIRGLLCIGCNITLGFYEKVISDPRYIQYLDARRKVA